MSSPATKPVDHSITLDGTSQVLFQEAPWNGIQERFVHNPDATHSIAINIFGAPAVLNGKGSITLAPGGWWAMQVTGAINVIGTNGSVVTAGER